MGYWQVVLLVLFVWVLQLGQSYGTSVQYSYDTVDSRGQLNKNSRRQLKYFYDNSRDSNNNHHHNNNDNLVKGSVLKTIFQQGSVSRNSQERVAGSGRKLSSSQSGDDENADGQVSKGGTDEQVEVQVEDVGYAPHLESLANDHSQHFKGSIEVANQKQNPQKYASILHQTRTLSQVAGTTPSPSPSVCNSTSVRDAFVTWSGVLVIVLVSIFSILLGSFLGYYAQGVIQQQRNKLIQEQKVNGKMLRQLMAGLVSWKGPINVDAHDLFSSLPGVCFVITDIEASTSISKQNPMAFMKLQDLHDQIFRQNVARHGGYEIITEGDSFHIAFVSVAKAVKFCMETQYALLESNWPRQILQLPSCKTVLSSDKSSILYRGPRIRMGLHWAHRDTITSRLHQLTRHRVFEGPGLQVAKELGQAAHGGQVLLSQIAWEHLQGSIGTAGFPVIEQIGKFQTSSLVDPIWIYNVRELLCKPLNRKFDLPRGLKEVSKGLGLAIINPHEPPPYEPLVFVAVRIETDIEGDLPKTFAGHLLEVIATQAQYFEGYMFREMSFQGRFMLSFLDAIDAVRFCHASQAVFMCTQWPKEARPYFGKTEMDSDPLPTFKGPRAAMAIHHSDQFQMLKLESDDKLLEYKGEGPEFAEHLCECIFGGQVVLSEPCWTQVQQQLPGQSQVISLGEHMVRNDPADVPMILMEVLPSTFSKRNFPPPRTFLQLSPGYRESPSPKKSMAIVFVQVSKPKLIVDIENGESKLSSTEIEDTMTVYRLSVSICVDLVRNTLGNFNGYECKEPDPGKFTLAFGQLTDAIRWCCYVQQALLVQDWPQELMNLGGCYEQWNSTTRRLIWRGLRMRMGIAYGLPQARKPLNTGRADYFGDLPNLAARVMSLASPGQVLLQGGEGFAEPAIQWISKQFQPLGVLHYNKTDSMGKEIQSKRFEYNTPEPSLPSSLSEHPYTEKQQWLSQFSSFAQPSRSYTCPPADGLIEIRSVGSFLLKGIDDPQPIYQAISSALIGREYQVQQEAVMVSMHQKNQTGIVPKFKTIFRNFSCTYEADGVGEGQSFSSILGGIRRSKIRRAISTSFQCIRRRFSDNHPGAANAAQDDKCVVRRRPRSDPENLHKFTVVNVDPESRGLRGYSVQSSQQEQQHQRKRSEYRARRASGEVQLYLQMASQMESLAGSSSKKHSLKQSRSKSVLPQLVQRSGSSSSAESLMSTMQNGKKNFPGPSTRASDSQKPSLKQFSTFPLPQTRMGLEARLPGTLQWSLSGGHYLSSFSRAGEKHARNVASLYACQQQERPRSVISRRARSSFALYESYKRDLENPDQEEDINKVVSRYNTFSPSASRPAKSRQNKHVKINTSADRLINYAEDVRSTRQLENYASVEMQVMSNERKSFSKKKKKIPREIHEEEEEISVYVEKEEEGGKE